MTVFKAYDVRGVYGDQLDEALARRIGDAFVRLLGARSLVVGRDMRTMAPSMAEAFVEGAMRAGAQVKDIGLASTPMTYYAIGTLGTDGGVQVTASHNPPEYIGFKFCRKGCVPVSGPTGISDMERMVKEPLPPAAASPGAVVQVDVMSGYIDHVMTFASAGIKPLRVVIDTANGMAGYALTRLLERLPINAEVLFQDLDGTFPNHEADPLKEKNLAWVSAAVKKSGADLGVAFDGDADRCVFVDEMGRPIRSDFATAALVPHFMAKAPGTAVVYDLRSTRAVAEAIAAAGGTPVRERVGHSFIKATMREHNAVFGGELSGHFYFRDNFVSDSGAIAMVTMLSVLSEFGGPVSALVAPFQKYASTGEINFHVADPDAVFAEMRERFADAKMDELDGITISYSDWWFNLRKSNTEPLVRLNLEADTLELLHEKRALIEPLLGSPE